MLYQIIISLILAIWLLNMALNMRFLPVPRRNAAVPSLHLLSVYTRA
jgi:hypothetical protein